MIEQQLIWHGLDFHKWITNGETVKGNTVEEYVDSRKYYEGDQAPDSLPDKFTYVQENLITDMVNGMVGSIVEGDINLSFSGGDERTKAITELARDMFERSGFNLKREMWGNYLYVEGLSPVEFYFNPRKKSIYGVGMPEIHIHPPAELLLDPNSKGFMHEDDIFRILKTRVLKTYAEKRWPEMKDKIYSSMSLSQNDETEEFFDMYFIEFRQIVFEKDKTDGVTYERDKYYWTKIINKTVMLEEPVASGFDRFTLLSTIHTPRNYSEKDPMGAVKIIKQVQDMINQIGSIAYEAMKSDIHKCYYISGVDDPKLKIEIENRLTEPGGIAFGPVGSKIDVLTGNGLSVSTIQMYEWKRKAFDEQSGRYAPERGASEQALSGVAIAQLQSRGKTPEETKKIHMEFVLNEIGHLLLECAVKKMSQQSFSIDRTIEGEKKKLYFNTPANSVQGFKQDEYNILDEEGLINSLVGVDVDQIDVSVELTLNAGEKEAFEANKAMAMANSGRLATIDLMKKMYPKEWYELYKNLESEQQALQIKAMIDQNPEAGQQIMQGLSTINQMFSQQQKKV